MLKELLTGSVDKIVDSVASGLDSLFTSDEEKLILKNELERIRLQAKEENRKIAMEYEKELTKRNQSDQMHGNFLTKSARPIFLYWIMFILSCMVFGGMNGIVINEAYIDMVQVLAVTAVSFFFGSKGFEYWKHGKQI